MEFEIMGLKQLFLPFYHWYVYHGSGLLGLLYARVGNSLESNLCRGLGPKRLILCVSGTRI
jgi:hypothetical protein